MSVRNLIVLLYLVMFTSCEDQKTKPEMSDMSHEGHLTQSKIYTCPMHPEIIRDAPGQCPICKMDLVEKANEGEASSNDIMDVLLKPTNEYVLSEVKTINPKQMELPVEISATGKITYDSREVSVVSARFTGRIDKLYIKYRFQQVKKGSKLMDIYSEKLVTEQENYIYLLKNDPDNKSMIKTAEHRLLLQGLTSEQINELRKTKTPFIDVTIYSPYSGHLHELSNASSKNTEMSENNEMGGMENMNATNSSELEIKEGMYVKEGQSIFKIYNTSKVWAILNVYSNKIDQVKIGQKVKIKTDNENSFDHHYTINFIEPEIKPEESTIPVRVYMSNTDNRLTIGSNIKAVIEAGNKKGLFIPLEAVVHLGNKTVVFIKENELLKAHAVQIGIETNKWIEITSGLNETDEIAENAQLLMDSESFIKIKNN